MEEPRDQLTWWGVPPGPARPVRWNARATDPNPLVAIYGPGPVGARCGTCAHLVRWHYGRTYRKCRIRGLTHGEATDHFATWPACGRYVAGEV
jgi:hypothetical protein